MKRYKNTVRSSNDGQFFDEIKEDPNGETVYLEDVQQLARECLPWVANAAIQASNNIGDASGLPLVEKLRAIIGEATAQEPLPAETRAATSRSALTEDAGRPEPTSQETATEHSCHCPAGPGGDCPLTVVECKQRVTNNAMRCEVCGHGG